MRVLQRHCCGVVGRDCRISFTKLSNLFGGLNALSPTHAKSYWKVAGKVYNAAMLMATQIANGASTDSDLLDV